MVLALAHIKLFKVDLYALNVQYLIALFVHLITPAKIVSQTFRIQMELANVIHH